MADGDQNTGILPSAEGNLNEDGTPRVDLPQQIPGIPPIPPTVRVSEPQVNAVSVRLSPFWTNLPNAWFMTTEAAFATSGITREHTKYGCVLQVLTQDVASMVYDVMKDISTTNADRPYTLLKDALINRYTVSESRRIETLISGVDIGDRTPSEFYRHLTSLAGSSEVMNDKLILELWTRRLPRMVQATLKATIKTEIRELLKLADEVYDVYRSEKSATLLAIDGAHGDTTQAQVNSRFERDIADIKRLLQDLSVTKDHQPRSQERRRSQSRSRSKSRSSNQPENDICWYHNKYGKDARNCAKPCKFNKQSPN